VTQSKTIGQHGMADRFFMDNDDYQTRRAVGNGQRRTAV
jgi:hypothetical protein